MALPKWFVLFMLLSFLAVPLRTGGAPPPGDASAQKGQTLFEQKCSTCHTIGGGKKIGPDLQGVTRQRSRDWLEKFISDPHRMIAAQDPAATQLLAQFGLEMPNLGLSPTEVSDLIAYLGSAGTPAQAEVPPAKPQAAAPAELAAGSPQEGEELFAGTRPLRKGGPPCSSCHDIAGLPFPGGGSLGPDLSGVYARLGAAGLSSALATLPFPTMTPIFGKRPLTPREQQDLGAYLEKAGGQPPARRIWPGFPAAALLVLLLILFQAVWRNRLRRVRKPVAEKGVEP